jgi:hypothetical protein
MGKPTGQNERERTSQWPAHQVDSVALIGWAGIENGELLKQAVEACS